MCLLVDLGGSPQQTFGHGLVEVRVRYCTREEGEEVVRRGEGALY